ncbi:alpha/beta hydrolase fold domain-containing protein [Planococcus sp. APC 4015]|nr:alpha/beta hydrolase fold domain-containing protein [Planococcus sp. APC 4015]
MNVPSHPPFDPEVVEALEMFRGMSPAAFDVDAIPGLRAAMVVPPLEQQLPGLDLESRDVTIPGHRGDDIHVTVIHRRGRTGTGPGIYNVHGGGMVFGSPLSAIARVAGWIEQHDAVVVSVAYRLAPEFPDPYPLEDTYAGLVWTADHTDDLGIDPARLLVVGGSAGGGLAAGAVLLARDRGGPAIAGQLLISPMLDDRDETVSTRQIDGVGVWDRASNVVGWTALLGDRKGTDDVSIYSAPARATDLSGLPPTFVDCASPEVFRDEDIAFAERIWAAGGDAELHVWAGGFHGFDMIPTAQVSAAARAARDTWVARILSR